VRRVHADNRQGSLTKPPPDGLRVDGNLARGPGRLTANLERFDARISDLLPALRDSDLLVITADHGNDPTTTSTDHSREYVPLLVTGARTRAAVDLGVRPTFADLGQTLASVFEVGPTAFGTSFLGEICES
jgi:phosphopentomutase